MERPCFIICATFALACASGAIATAEWVSAEDIHPPLRSLGEKHPLALQNKDVVRINEFNETQPRKLEGEETQNDVTCTLAAGPAAEKPETTITIDEYTLKATFTCGDGQNASLAPACTESSPSSKCCNAAACSGSNEQDISVVLGDADGRVTQASTKKYTIALDRMPKRDKKMYYKCKESDGEDAKVCVVTVKMPKEPPKGKSTLR